MLVWCMLFFTNRGTSSLYFSTGTFHPNETVNKKGKVENVTNEVSKISYSCIISKQMWRYCRQQSKYGG